MTIAVDASDREQVQSHLLRLAEEGELLWREESPHSGLLKSFYHAFYLNYNLTTIGTIQTGPRKAGQRYMRVEWNPATARRIYKDSAALIMNMLTECLPDFLERQLPNANITRIDLSFDLRRVAVDSLLVFSNTTRKSLSERYHAPHYKYPKTGRLNSMDIGKKDSKRYLLLYDKNLEREDRQIGGFSYSPEVSRRGATRVKPSRTRFELRCKDVGNLTALYEMENPFEAYSVLSYINTGGLKTDHVWRWFIESCKSIGAQASLALIEDRRERTKFANALRECQPPSWWNPAEIWKELPSAILKALGIDPHSH
jgi:hypothetical protein